MLAWWAPSRRHIIIQTNDGPVDWRINASSGLKVFIKRAMIRYDLLSKPLHLFEFVCICSVTLVRSPLSRTVWGYPLNYMSILIPHTSWATFFRKKSSGIMVLHHLAHSVCFVATWFGLIDSVVMNPCIIPGICHAFTHIILVINHRHLHVSGLSVSNLALSVSILPVVYHIKASVMICPHVAKVNFR